MGYRAKKYWYAKDSGIVYDKADGVIIKQLDGESNKCPVPVNNGTIVMIKKSNGDYCKIEINSHRCKWHKHLLGKKEGYTFGLNGEKCLIEKVIKT